MPSWPPAAKWAVGCGSGCALLVLFEAIAAWGLLAFIFNLRPPEGMVARVTAPPQVRVGKPFPLTLTVRNEGDSPFTLGSVTARPGLLEKLSLDDPQPTPRATTSALGSRVWSYQDVVHPRATFTVRFTAEAKAPGELRSALELQSNWFPKSVPFTIKVEDSKPEREPPRTP